MFQSILYFVLGFLCAAFLALLASPAVWRRAVVLTRRRIEAALPLSLNEIQADKDRLRADFAMSTRRLEMNIKALREKTSLQTIEIHRRTEDAKRLAAEHDAARETILELQAQGAGLRADLADRDKQAERLAARLADADRHLDERERQQEDLNRLYNDASLNASNRQIDLVARETQVEKLTGDIAIMRDQRRENEKRLREVTAEARTAEEALKAEKQRAGDLETRMQRMMSALPDREDKLERREKELERLRDEVKLLTASEDKLAEQLTVAQSERLKLEAELADMVQHMQAIMDGSVGGGLESAVAKLTAERDSLEVRLVKLSRENNKLRETMSRLEREGAQTGTDDRREGAVLRERITNLAAEVVSLTMALEGPESPIKAALKPVANGGALVTNAPIVNPLSIADRVRALQKAVSAN